MKVFSVALELKDEITALLSEGKTIGFVPTMGALHKGHLSLIENAKKNNDVVVVSIFVNPTQFDNQNDLEKYPRTLISDTKMLEEIGCDYVFTPTIQELYPNEVVSKAYDFGGIEKEMEGKFRTGHFDGVGTVVHKLFEVVQPSRAYFGEKDFQQLQIIRKMVEIEQLSVAVIGCPIFREPSGLAMSSRNTRLSSTQFQNASLIYQALKEVKELFPFRSISDLNKLVVEKFQDNDFLELEYFEIANEKNLKTAIDKKESENYRAFIAVFAGDVRLIDNMAMYDSKNE